MPYIKKEQRAELDAAIGEIKSSIGYIKDLKATDRAGILNYIISELLDVVLVPGSKWNYAACNTAIGVLECAKLELYRRLVAPYEDTKIEENGDIGTYE